LGTRTGLPEQASAHPWADRPKTQLREYVETIIVCVLVFVFLRGFVVQQSEIPSGSMEDTVLPGDYILVNRFLYAPTELGLERSVLPIREIERGDLVVFKHPQEPERDFIKRIIGLPGDVVEMRQGYVWINGREIDEPYINPLYRQRGSLPPLRVPDGQYFVLGDHRNNSADSRSWGMVPRGLIKGRAFMVLFSTQAMPRNGEPPGKVTVRSTIRKIWYLAFHSRWDRALRTIR
jgi:signal peptidase I